MIIQSIVWSFYIGGPLPQSFIVIQLMWSVDPHIHTLWYHGITWYCKNITIIVMISQIMILSQIIIIWYWKAQLWSRLNWPTLRSTRGWTTSDFCLSCFHIIMHHHIMSWCLDIVNSAYLSIWTHGWRGWRLPGFSDELVCCTWKYLSISLSANMICYTCKSVIIVIFWK